MNEEDSDPEDSIKPSAEKTKEARAAVREALHEQRVKRRGLRKGMKEGRDLSADMDTCQGEIELLQKELQAIDEGGHVTFLEAKNLIAPKKEISAKKTKLREETHRLKKEITHSEARLSMPNLTDEERSRMLGSISEKNDAVKGLEEEMEALRNFDHTRFVEAREESRRSMELEEALGKLESRKEELTGQMLEALEQANEPLIGELHEKINLIEEERKKLLEPDGDPLLQEESPDK